MLVFVFVSLCLLVCIINKPHGRIFNTGTAMLLGWQLTWGLTA